MKLDFSYYKAFIFDLDGTLIDSEKYHTNGFAAAVFELSGYQVTEDERKEFFEAHTKKMLPILSERHGLEFNVDEVLRRKRELVEKNFKAEVFPQAINFMRKWRSKKRMALASNSPKQFVKDALIKARMIDLFEVVNTADDVTHRKPDPEMYLLTLEQMNVSADEVLIFEDSRTGVIAAKEAKCPFVMVENGSDRAVDGVEKITWRELSRF